MSKLKIEQDLRHYKDISQQIKALTKQQEEIKKRLLTTYFSKHSEYITKSGAVLATYSATTRQTFDTKRFKDDHPAIHQAYSNEQVIKTFLVK